MARDRGRERVVGPFGLQRLLVLALARLVLGLADERRGWRVWDPGADPSNGTGAVGDPEIAIRPRGDSVRRAAGIEAGAELGDLPGGADPTDCRGRARIGKPEGAVGTSGDVARAGPGVEAHT